MENINDFDSVRDEQQAIQNSTPSERTHTHTQDFSHLSQPNNQAASESTAPDETVINNGINSASEGVETSPYLPPTLDKPLQLAPATQLAGGKKENPIEPKKPIEPKPIAKNHAIFILPPHKWDKSQITKTATDTSYIVENVWIREQVGADNKITYHYYQAGYDINEALCWQYFEPQTEQKVSTETDIPLVTVEERRYTPEELAAIKQRRRELMYAIASDEKLFFQFYLNENYSQEFRTQLYHMKIAIGRGEVAMVVAGVGFSFMAMAAAPVLIEGAMALPSVSASALKSIASTGVNAAKGIARGMKSAKDMAMAALKDMPKDMLKGTLIDKVGEAIGIPLGILFDLRDAKEIVRDLGKYWAKNPNPKLLTPDGHEIDLDSPMQFSKETDLNKGSLSGGKKTTHRKTNTTEIKSFKSTEIDAQNPKAIAEIENKLLNGDIYLFAEPINILKTNNNYYILDGHHRLQAALNTNYKGDIPITELSLEEAKRLFPNKVFDIEQGFFD